MKKIIILGVVFLVAIFVSSKISWEKNSENQNTTFAPSLFYVAYEDNGATGSLIGCGDSIVAVPYINKKGTFPEVIGALLSEKNAEIGQSGLHNALANSNLSVVEASVEGDSATLRLSGNFSIAGVCDVPRVEAQLVETALQFPGVKSVRILVNDVPLADVLSSK